ncbi:potassium voltage-gated channel subfamily KQT member 5 [Elysia marginata]|uniref:Potassium voltage-gated channel subfamily KQT member 5 n=1 Tax=Elysia marginata TaxID=1093978 RepID=A0AAV4FTU9_9GAST|nr:potassium voltage-gated channel subfamily KQT member 5 [Elysia marginata]
MDDLLVVLGGANEGGGDCKQNGEDLDLSPRLTQLTEQHKKAIRAIRKIRYFVSRRKFREARRPYDVKDVIEQYSAGHVDMLGRIKNLQGRLDQILGRQGSKSKDVYESKICLASRIVKVERQVDDIETKVDLLVDMYKEDRKFLLTHIQHIYSGNAPPTDPNRVSQAPLPDGGNASSEKSNQGKKSLSGFKPRPILIDKQFTSEPATPTGFVTGGGAGVASSSRLGARPGIQRNLSDLSQRIKKRVTYRGLPQNHHDPPSRAQSAACFPVSSLPPPPSSSPTSSDANSVSFTTTTEDSLATSPPPPLSPSTLTNHQPHSPDALSSGASSLPGASILRISSNSPPKIPPPVPYTATNTSPNLSNTSPHLNSLQSSPSCNTQFRYPACDVGVHVNAEDADVAHQLDTVGSASPHPSRHSSCSNRDDNHENLISFSYDNGNLSTGQGHFDAVYYAKEPQNPVSDDGNRHFLLQQSSNQQQHEDVFFEHNPEHQLQSLASSSYHPASQHHNHHHHHHSHPPGSMLSSLIGTSLATVTEQRSTDSDSGQYLSDTNQSSPSRLPTSSAGQTDDEGADNDSKGFPSPSHVVFNEPSLEPLPQTATELPPENSDRPLSPPQCSADSVCSETSSTHEDELAPFLPATEEKPRPPRPKSCDASIRSGLPRQSSEVLTSPSTTSSQASLLTDSRSYVARGNSQSNASFSPDALFDERETTFVREGTGSIS